MPRIRDKLFLQRVNAKVFLRRVWVRLQNDGIGGLARSAKRRFKSKLSSAGRRRPRPDQDFDLQYGVKTSGIIQLNLLDVASQNQSEGSRYQPVEPDFFHEIMRLLPSPPPLNEFVFIDIGSGMGRALLMASDYPFQRIVGVEFSRELHAIAMQNIQTYQNPRQSCRKIESICADAISYELPPEPMVLFFFYPFTAAIMEKVMVNITASLQARPRPAFLAVMGGKLHAPVEAAGFERLAETVKGPNGDPWDSAVFRWPNARATSR